MRLLIIAPLALVLAVSPALGLGGGGGAAGQDGASGTLSLDHATGDNTASAVGSIQECDTKPLSAGQEFTADIVVQGIPGNGEDMGAFQTRITFDSSVINFVSIAVSDPAGGAQFFLEKAGTPQVAPVSGENAPGDWTVGGFQLGSNRGNNGDGLLARLTFRVVGSGVTNINLEPDGNTFYADVSFTNHDFDTVNSGAVGINQACVVAQPTATPVGGPPAADATPVTPFQISAKESVNRYSSPSTQGGQETVVGALAAGETATAIAQARGEAVDADNDIWYELEDGSFVYSGALELPQGGGAPGADDDGQALWPILVAGLGAAVLALAGLAWLAWRLRNRFT